MHTPIHPKAAFKIYRNAVLLFAGLTFGSEFLFFSLEDLVIEK